MIQFFKNQKTWFSNDKNYLHIFFRILVRRFCHTSRIPLYLLTVLDALKGIQFITLVSFFSEISIGSFWSSNLHYFTFQETVGSHLKLFRYTTHFLLVSRRFSRCCVRIVFQRNSRAPLIEKKESGGLPVAPLKVNNGG